MTWHVVDAGGRDLATGRLPMRPGRPSPLAALAATPVAAWPLRAVDDGGRSVGVGEALGTGGDRVERLLGRLAVRSLPADGGRPFDAAALEERARATPAGPVGLPVDVVTLRVGVEAAGRVDQDWLVTVDGRRAAAHRAVVAAGRSAEMEAALHLAMLAATERFDPADDADVDAHVASGARLWLVTAAVASALASTFPDPFATWCELVVAGWWPVGPSGGRLVISAVHEVASSAGAAAPGAG